MLTMLKRHEIQVLKRAGHTAREVARVAGVSYSSVRRVEKEAPVSQVDDAVARRSARVGRPSTVAPYREEVMKLLEGEPTMKAVEVLHRLRQRGYKGGKTAVFDLVASLRPKEADLVSRFEGLPGEFSQHDFGQVDVTFTDGHAQRVHFFASRLKYSRWVSVSLVPNQKVEPLVRTLVDHFAQWGGIPLLAVFDRPRTIALSWRRDGSVTEWNTTFAYLMVELGLGVELCWPHSPRQKGSVENLVGWVKGSFFKQRRFHDMDDLRAQLAAWQEEVNTQRPSRATEEIPSTRMVAERARLRPLKVAPAQLALRLPIQVGPTGFVPFQTNLYAMPPDAAGLTGTLFLYRDRVRIVAGRHEASHPRLLGRRERTSQPEHRAARLAALSGKRGKGYLKRQDLLDTGAAASDYLTEIIHRRPNNWFREVDMLHDLLQRYGSASLNEALVRAVDARTFGVEYVSHFLSQPTLFPHEVPHDPQ
jgi:transposase